MLNIWILISVLDSQGHSRIVSVEVQARGQCYRSQCRGSLLIDSL